jgi:hypothetical protein
LKAKASNVESVVRFEVNAGDPATVANENIQLGPPAAVAANVTLDAPLRQRVIDAVESTLTEYYVDAPSHSK